MQFNSLEYGLLLLASWFVFQGMRGRGRIWLLIVASLLFYASWNVPLTSLILISAIVDFGVARAIFRSDVARTRKLLLSASLGVNLGMLATFKYANFAIESVHALIGDGAGTSLIAVVLPPGISFYTFQTMGYTIDVYRRQMKPTRSFGDFLLFVSFFPQLIAGPIERAGRLLPQIRATAGSRGVDPANVVDGLQLITWGLFKKTMIADPMGEVAAAIYARPGAFDDWSALAATYAFTLQIYCDFSAYSEIAKGSAKLFGIDLIWNFDQPYLSRSPAEFWRRWHISLSEWFRDYVYIPLGGNRLGRSRTLFNLAATMFLSGLWHGAAWHFVLWGLYHGLLLLLDAQLPRLRAFASLRRVLGRSWSALSWLVMFHAVVAGWVLFRVERIADAPGILLAMVRAPLSGIAPSAGQAGIFAIVAFFLVATALDAHLGIMKRIRGDRLLGVPFHACVVVISLALASSGATPFIYFQF